MKLIPRLLPVRLHSPRVAVKSDAERCLDCVHFRNDPDTVERLFPGFTAMGSPFADVRAYDGLCSRHGVYLSFSDRCAEFERPLTPAQ